MPSFLAQQESVFGMLLLLELVTRPRRSAAHNRDMSPPLATHGLHGSALGRATKGDR